MTKRFLIFPLFCVCLWLACKLEKVDDPDGGCPTPPVANFSVDKSSGNVPLTVIFTNNSSGATTYQWDFQSGSNSTDAQPGSKQFATAGNYTVKLIATAKAGCSDTFSLVIMVVEPQAPVQVCAQVTSTTNNGAAPSVVSFSAACSANATSFAWDFGDPASGGSNTSTGITTNHAYATEGTYNVKLIATGPAGSEDTTLVVTIAQGSTPPFAAFTITNGSCTAPCDVVFTNTSTDATSFEWDFGDGTPIVTQGNPTHKYELPGDYVVKLTATGPGGTDIETKTVLVKPITFKKTFGGLDGDSGTSVKQTLDGGYILLGSTASEGAGGYDVYLIKTDNVGNLVWKKTFGGFNDDWGRSVQQTSDNGYILLGQTKSEGAGLSDFYLIKTDNVGNLIWKKTYGGTNEEEAWAVQQTSDNGYILFGSTLSEGSGGYDLYLIKTSSAGDLLWKKTFGGSNYDLGYSVQKTSDGGYVLLGYTTSIGAGIRDVYLLKADNVGNLVWEKTFGGVSIEDGHSVQQTSDGGYVLLGDAYHQGAGGYDFNLIKTDNIGNLVWEKTFGGTNEDKGWSVQQTFDEGYVLLGNTESEGAGASDIYLIKTDNTGNIAWKKTFGGANDDVSYSVQQTSDGGYIMLGTTSSFGAGGTDFYLIKTDKDGNAQ